MYVTWDAQNGEPIQTWDFDADDLYRLEVVEIEKHYGGSWDQWLQGLRIGEMPARTVLLWHLLAQTNPKLQFKDVPNFRMKQLKVEMGVRELKDLWVKAKRMRMPAAQAEAFAMMFAADVRDAMEREGWQGTADVVDGELVFQGDGVDLPKLQ